MVPQTLLGSAYPRRLSRAVWLAHGRSSLAAGGLPEQVALLGAEIAARRDHVNGDEAKNTERLSGNTKMDDDLFQLRQLPWVDTGCTFNASCPLVFIYLFIYGVRFPTMTACLADASPSDSLASRFVWLSAQTASQFSNSISHVLTCVHLYYAEMLRKHSKTTQHVCLQS